MKIRILFMFFIFWITNNFAQNEKLYFNDNKVYTQTYIDSVLTKTEVIYIENYKYIDEFGKILRSNNELLGWPHYYYGKGRKAFLEQKIDSVDYYLSKSIASYENAKIKRTTEEEILLRVYLTKAYLEEVIRLDYKKSIVYNQKALDLTKKYPYSKKSYIVAGLASSHLAIGNDSLALHYYLKVIKDTLYMSIPRPASSAYGYTAMLYDKKDCLRLSKKYYHKALGVLNKSTYKANLYAAHASLALIMKRERKNDSMIYHYKKASAAMKKYGLGDASDIAMKIENVADIHILVYEKKYQEAILRCKNVIDSISKMEILNEARKDIMLEFLELLAESYQKQGNPKEYTSVLNQTIHFLNKTHKQQLDEDLLNLELKYQTKEKDEAIVQLEKSKQQQQIIIKQRTLMSFVGLIVIMLIVGIGIIFFRQRRLKTEYDKVNLEQRLLRSQMNPHFIYNALNSVSGLIEAKSPKTILYINKLASLFRLILENSREEFVGLGEELNALENYLELQSNFTEKFTFTINVEETIDNEETIIPPMLIQPFIENAIVHGISSQKNNPFIHVNIIFAEEDQLLKCEIHDNGIGYHNSNTINGTHKSMSSKIIKERLDILQKQLKLNARFTIEKVEEGTKIILYIPYKLDK